MFTDQQSTKQILSPETTGCKALWAGKATVVSRILADVEISRKSRKIRNN